ncbi:hypothetical protein AX762_10940 [Alkalibacterium sp. 20]|nr:hypothetical protein AX762_10940 [Alkalibacterium sp. 20]
MINFLNENTTIVIILLLVGLIVSTYIHNKGMVDWARKPIFLIPLGIIGAVALLFTLFAVFIS